MHTLPPAMIVSATPIISNINAIIMTKIHHQYCAIIISCNMLFASDVVDELVSEASTVIQPAVIAAVHHYMKRKNGRQRSFQFAQQ